MTEDSPADYAAHDHTTEDAFIAFVEDPTPETEHAAELAIARLQRRYDSVLRRVDGVVERPAESSYRHHPTDDPYSCLEEVLHELAGGTLSDRAEVLALGLKAARALEAANRSSEPAGITSSEAQRLAEWRRVLWSLGHGWDNQTAGELAAEAVPALLNLVGRLSRALAAAEGASTLEQY